MFVHAKTILTSYGKFSGMAEDLENLIFQSAIGSFRDTSPCSTQAERICKLIEKKNLLVNLYVKAKRALNALTQEEVNVLAKKFAGASVRLYFSERTYFRKVASALVKYSRALERQGITKQSFISDYAQKLPFLQAVMDRVIYEADATSRRAETYKLNRTFKSNMTATNPLNLTLSTQNGEEKGADEPPVMQKSQARSSMAHAAE